MGILSWLGDFLNNVGTTLISLFGLIVHGIESLLDLFVRIPTYVSALTSAVAYLPAVYQGVIIAGISVAVILLITGRN